MRTNLYRCSIAVLLAAVFGWGWVAAQDVKDGKSVSPEEPPADKIYDVPFWDRDEGIQIRAASAVVGAGDLMRAMCTRVAISENVPILRGWEFDFERAIPLDYRNLERIQDGRPLPDIRRVPFKELDPRDRAFYRAFLEALWRSDMATVKMLENSAEQNKHVVYAHLNKKPEQFRGKIIPVKGKLKLIRREDPPRYLDVEHLKDIYTGWIIGPTKGAPPFTIVFTQLPEKLGVSEDLDVDVTFQGYFLGLVRFPANKDGKKDVISPYLVGKTLIVHNRPPVVKANDEDSPYSYTLIVWSFGGIVGVVVIGAAMMLWYRSHDRKVRTQLAEVRDKHQPFNLEPDSAPVPEETAPVMETKSPNGTSPPMT